MHAKKDQQKKSEMLLQEPQKGTTMCSGCRQTGGCSSQVRSSWTGRAGQAVVSTEPNETREKCSVRGTVGILVAVDILVVSTRMCIQVGLGDIFQ